MTHHALDVFPRNRSLATCGTPVADVRRQLAVSELCRLRLTEDENRLLNQVMAAVRRDRCNPHWLSRDPRSNRLVLGAELGGEEGFYGTRGAVSTGGAVIPDWALGWGGRIGSDASWVT